MKVLVCVVGWVLVCVVGWVLPVLAVLVPTQHSVFIGLPSALIAAFISNPSPPCRPSLISASRYLH